MELKDEKWAKEWEKSGKRDAIKEEDMKDRKKVEKMLMFQISPVCDWKCYTCFVWLEPNSQKDAFLVLEE